MNEIKEQKLQRLKKINKYQSIILELSNWKVGDKLKNSTIEEVGEIYDETRRDFELKKTKELIKLLEDKKPDDNKKYLAEIIKEEKPRFLSNTLILAPVGSGKTTLMKQLLDKKSKRSIMLVSNTALKDAVSPKEDKFREILGNRTYTSQNERVYGDGEHKIHVMSYAEFGKRIEIHNDILEDVSQIFCDEIHSLTEYYSYSRSNYLSHAIKYLLGQHSGKQIFYFTATDEHLINFEKSRPGAFRYIVEYDYRNHKDIRQYMALAQYKVRNMDEIRVHLVARHKTFRYFNYKCLAFSKTIEGEKKLEQIAAEEGFKPITLWSINNEEHALDEEQLRVRDHLLKKGYIPEPYNFLIINSSMQEGWDLKDSSVRLAILNTTNETEKIQALGRLRGDTEVLIYKVKENEQSDDFIDLPDKYYEEKLTNEEKSKLCEEINEKLDGKTMRWPTVKRLLENQGYNIEDGKGIINGKQKRYSKIGF